ncbi:MAG: alpha/beta hydrolase [bacterium]
MSHLLTIDPFLFTDDAISTETKIANKNIEQQLAKAPPLAQVDINIIRNSLQQGVGLLGKEPLAPTADWMAITPEDTYDNIKLRVIPPKGPLAGIYLHLHPGGYCFGGADYQDQSLQNFASATGLLVLSVDYRLAPEHPWPAGVDDCTHAATWLLKNGEKHFGVRKFFIGGESAGAHYAAITLLRLRDLMGQTGFSAAILTCGDYDMSMTPSLRLWGPRNLGLNTESCAFFGEKLFPSDLYDMESRRHPDISPLFASLDNLPPALFTIGTFDPVLDDSLFMAGRYLAAGNRTELAIYPGGIHTFTRLPIKIAQQANDRIHNFISDLLE